MKVYVDMSKVARSRGTGEKLLLSDSVIEIMSKQIQFRTKIWKYFFRVTIS